MPLDNATIQALYATRRTKGQYEDLLVEFLNSDENGFSVKDDHPMLADKTASTLYQGFRNAAEKLEVSKVIDVINRDGQVFVLHTERVVLNGDS